MIGCLICAMSQGLGGVTSFWLDRFHVAAVAALLKQHGGLFHAHVMSWLI